MVPHHGREVDIAGCDEVRPSASRRVIHILVQAVKQSKRVSASGASRGGSLGSVEEPALSKTIAPQLAGARHSAKHRSPEQSSEIDKGIRKPRFAAAALSCGWHSLSLSCACWQVVFDAPPQASRSQQTKPKYGKRHARPSRRSVRWREVKLLLLQEGLSPGQRTAVEQRPHQETKARLVATRGRRWWLRRRAAVCFNGLLGGAVLKPRDAFGRSVLGRRQARYVDEASAARTREKGSDLLLGDAGRDLDDDLVLQITSQHPLKWRKAPRPRRLSRNSARASRSESACANWSMICHS